MQSNPLAVIILLLLNKPTSLCFIFYLWPFLLPLYEGFGWGARQWKVLPGLRGVFGELIRQQLLPTVSFHIKVSFILLYFKGVLQNTCLEPSNLSTTCNLQPAFAPHYNGSTCSANVRASAPVCRVNNLRQGAVRR